MVTQKNTPILMAGEMCEAGEVLAALRARDIRLMADGDQLRYDAPVGAVTTEIVALLQQHKPGLFALLQQAHASAIPSPAAPPVTIGPCTHPAHCPPTATDGPTRQCRHCPHVWQLPCSGCGAASWKATAHWGADGAGAVGWTCTGCGARYGESSIQGKAL